MRILSLDPSSSITGYAVIDGSKVVDAGTLRPNKTRDDSNQRIRVMVAEVAGLVKEHKPDWIVIEDTSGKAQKRHGGGGAGLSIYGKAIGWFACECEKLMPGKVKMILENEWTRGVSKKTRQSRVASLVKGYDAANDKGADTADAIGLGLYASARLAA